VCKNDRARKSWRGTIEQGCTVEELSPLWNNEHILIPRSCRSVQALGICARNFGKANAAGCIVGIERFSSLQNNYKRTQLESAVQQEAFSVVR